MPHRKPCVREDSWCEKEAASERRRRKRGRPAFEAATSVWHTSQSVCVHQTRSRTGRDWRAGAMSAMKRSGHERGDDLGRGAGVRNRQTRF